MSSQQPITNSPDDPAPDRTIAVNFEYTPALPEILKHLNAALLITTYQAGKLLVLSVREGKLAISFLDYDQPMGIAVAPDRIAVGTRRQIHFLVAAHETVTPPRPPQFNDGCFVPRASAYTGSIHGHDLGTVERQRSLPKPTYKKALARRSAVVNKADDDIVVILRITERKSLEIQFLADL